MGRSKCEAHFCDIGDTIIEIKEFIKGLNNGQGPKDIFQVLQHFFQLKKVCKMPYGVSLIISPFNFPVLLSLGFLSASMSGGNTAMVKMSLKLQKVPNLSRTILMLYFQKNIFAQSLEVMM